MLGHWTIVVWYPPSCPAADPVPHTLQSWFPIRACVNDRVATTPDIAVDTPVDLPPTNLEVHLGSFQQTPGAKPGVLFNIGACHGPPGGLWLLFGLGNVDTLGERVGSSLGCPHFGLELIVE
jgi:hypothetical protein